MKISVGVIFRNSYLYSSKDQNFSSQWSPKALQEWNLCSAFSSAWRATAGRWQRIFPTGKISSDTLVTTLFLTIFQVTVILLDGAWAKRRFLMIDPALTPGKMKNKVLGQKTSFLVWHWPEKQSAISLPPMWPPASHLFSVCLHYLSANGGDINSYPSSAEMSTNILHCWIICSTRSAVGNGSVFNPSSCHCTQETICNSTLLISGGWAFPQWGLCLRQDLRIEVLAMDEAISFCFGWI